MAFSSTKASTTLKLRAEDTSPLTSIRTTTHTCSHLLKAKSSELNTTTNVSQTHLYNEIGNLERPPFSSLNADVIPKPKFLESLEKHQPKFDTELIKELWKTIGLQTTDERIYKLGSAMLEVQMLKIISELRAVAP